MRVAALSGFFLSLMTILGVASAQAEGTPKVVVTIKPIHALVADVMSGVGTPALLVDGSASPHTFTLRPSTAQAVAEADVFIRVSPSLEPFTQKISAVLPSQAKLVTLVDAPGVRLLPRREGGTFDAHQHDHEHGDADGDEHGDHHAGHHDDEDTGGADPHIWLDPENAKAIANEVAKVLSQRDPQHAPVFAANAAALGKRLDAVSKDIDAELKPLRGRPFIIFHDSTQYFETRFDVLAAGSITVSPAVQPSARRLSEVRRKIEALGAVCVFAEPGYQPQLVQAVIEGSHAMTGEIDAEAQLLKPSPELYFDLLRSTARSIQSCLSSEGRAG